MFRIRQIIDERGITYRELAEAMKVSPQYIAQIVTEKKNVTVGTLSRLAGILDVPLAALFDGYHAPQESVCTIPCPHCGNHLHMQVK